MNHPDELGLDFELLERAGGVNFTARQRTLLEGAVAALSKDSAIPHSSLFAEREIQMVRHGIRGAECFLELLDLLLLPREGGLVLATEEVKKEQEIVDLGILVVNTIREDVRRLLPLLREYGRQWRPKRGRPRRFWFAVFMGLADRAYREAGGKGPYYDRSYFAGDHDSECQYRGPALEFFEELLKQVGCTRYTTRTSLAKAILDARNLLAVKNPSTPAL